jgi:hypothetical protein
LRPSSTAAALFSRGPSYFSVSSPVAILATFGVADHVGGALLALGPLGTLKLPFLLFALPPLDMHVSLAINALLEAGRPETSPLKEDDPSACKQNE